MAETSRAGQTTSTRNIGLLPREPATGLSTCDGPSVVNLPVGPFVKWCQFQELSNDLWCLQVGFLAAAAAAAAKSALVSSVHAICSPARPPSPFCQHQGGQWLVLTVESLHLSCPLVSFPCGMVTAEHEHPIQRLEQLLSVPCISAEFCIHSFV